LTPVGAGCHASTMSRLARSPAVVGALVLLAAPAADAGDVLVSGSRLAITGAQQTPAKRKLTFRTLDAAVAPPYADPTTGASLFLFASNQTGQCRAVIDLAAGNWAPIKGAGSNFGWRYTDLSGSAGGVRKVIVQRRSTGGKIVVKAKGAGFPCDLSAAAQSLPVAVTLTIGDTRYCAAFGGTVRANQSGRLKASNAPAPGACVAPDDLTGATLNQLHGLTCPAGTGSCRLAERVALSGQWIVARGCPDVVAFQEVFNAGPGSSLAELLADQLTNVCPFPYEVAYLKDNSVDDSLILSRYHVLSSQSQRLLNNLRNVLHVRIDHPIGLVDVFSTHLAAGVDSGSSPCGTGQPCPPECLAAFGMPTVRSCQAEQVALYVEAEHDLDTPALILGDFNQTPGSSVYGAFVNRGWTDAYLAGGNPECDMATGVGCTSGREDSDLSDLESPALGVDRRIDYAFVVPPAPASTCAGTIDSGADDDGDGVATRLFADEPNTFGPPCGPSPAPICWASDHDGVQVDVNCE
jgi:endonuclease/exonuclease/phosphatase family metal-dependent hydrolase